MFKILIFNKINLEKKINPRFSRGFFSYGFIQAAIIFILGIYATSCTEYEQMGINLIDNRVGLVETDTLTIVAYTLAGDPLVTNQTRNSLLGFYNDPLFGRMQASIYTETRLATTGRRIAGNMARDSILLDSIVLVMAYSGFHGDLSTPQNIRVHELNDTVPTSSILSNHRIVVKPEVLNQQWNPSTTYKFAPSDSLYLGPDSTRVIPQLRLRLNDNFGRRFIDAPLSDFESVASYLSFFRGFRITAEETTGRGAIAYFALGSPTSTLLVYFSILGDTVSTRSRVHEFPINEFARRFTQFENFEHQYAANVIRQQVVEGDTTQGRSNLFVQAMSNFNVRLHIPHLEKLFEADNAKPIIINSARLIIPADTTMITDNFGFAPNLFLARRDAEGVLVNMIDYFIGEHYFGGGYDNARQQYVFNITQHVQAVGRGNIPNSPLYIFVNNPADNAGRAVLSGTEAERALRVEINYSKPQ